MDGVQLSSLPHGMIAAICHHAIGHLLAAGTNPIGSQRNAVVGRAKKVSYSTGSPRQCLYQGKVIKGITTLSKTTQMRV